MIKLVEKKRYCAFYSFVALERNNGIANKWLKIWYNVLYEVTCQCDMRKTRVARNGQPIAEIGKNKRPIRCRGHRRGTYHSLSR